MRAVPSGRENVSHWWADHSKSAQSAIAAQFYRAISGSETRTSSWETCVNQGAEESESVP
jgi:hypothetical protein